MKWLYATISDFTTEELELLRASLSPSRAKRIRRLRRPEDQPRSLAGEALARKLLREQFGVLCPTLHCDELGCPRLPDTGLFVSIAHCGQHIVCAAAQMPVGIDIERIRPIDLSMAKHVCTEEEAAYLFGHRPDPDDYRLCHDPETLQRFYEIWTGKEAYFKMQGTGIRNLRSISILPLPREIILREGHLITITEKTV